jgi:peptidyl-dipeptidase A
VTSATSLIDAAEETLRPLTSARNRAWWDVNIEATKENERRRTETELAYSDALADAELFAAVAEAGRDSPEPVVQRGLDLLHDLMVRHQIPGSLRARIAELEASVGARFARHRGIVGGEEVDDNELKRILRESDDSAERREAWEASKTVGAVVAADVRTLARLRNEAARALGYRDWFALSLATDEMDEDKLIATLASADRATAAPFARWKHSLDARLAQRFRCDPSELRPWHYADPFFQEPPVEGGVDIDHLFRGRDLLALSRRTFDGLGVDVTGILERSDLFPRTGKNQHAFCIDIDRERDVRILANVIDDRSWMETMLHELGHGVYDLGFEDELQWLFRDTHLVTTEATAILFGGLAADRDWLERILELGSDEAGALDSALRSRRAAEALVFTRWVLVMNSLERELYADPDADLDALWWELVARYQLLTPPEDRQGPDWAAKIHFTVAPVYYHTYLYGSIVASQLRDAVLEEAGGFVDRPAAYALLQGRLFAPGQSVRWDRLVEQASGKSLSVESLAREVTAA